MNKLNFSNPFARSPKRAKSINNDPERKPSFHAFQTGQQSDNSTPYERPAVPTFEKIVSTNTMSTGNDVSALSGEEIAALRNMKIPLKVAIMMLLPLEMP